jgi:glutamyl-tRNA reductase
MEFGVIGISHKSGALEVREKFSLNQERLAEAFQFINQHYSFESVLLSTCNRFEIYFLSEGGLASAWQFIRRFFGVDDRLLEHHTYSKVGEEALRHLLRVVSGLDSLVLGENQILGQVRTAWLAAQEQKASRKLLNGIFERAVRFGKMSRTESTLNAGPVSISSIAVKLAEKELQILDEKTCLLIGSGEMARIAVQHLRDRGLSRLIVANRSLERAQELADEFSGKAIALDEIYGVIPEIDLVMSAAGGSAHILTRQGLEAAMTTRPPRPLVLVDIGVPRNIDQAIGELPGVSLYDVDSLESISKENSRLRQGEIEKIERWIDKEIAENATWLRTECVVPLIKELAARIERIQQESMQSIRENAPHLDDRTYELVARSSFAALNGILRTPIKRLKEMSVKSRPGDLEEVVNRFADLFELPHTDNSHLHKLVTKFYSHSMIGEQPTR